MGADRIGEFGNRASEGRGIWGRFYSRVSGRERSQGWDGEQAWYF